MVSQNTGIFKYFSSVYLFLALYKFVLQCFFRKLYINSFFLYAPFLYPLKTSENQSLLSLLLISKTLRLNNLKTRTAMNEKISVLVICVDTIIYLLLCVFIVSFEHISHPFLLIVDFKQVSITQTVMFRGLVALKISTELS